MMQTFAYGAAPSQVADLHLPPTRAPAVVCLLHGGFWRVPYGSDQMSVVARDLVALGFAVWNIEYRRLGEPGAGWRAPLEDVAGAIDHLATLTAAGVALDLARVAVVGHSAGGQLALCAGARPRSGRERLSPRKVRPVAVAALAAVCDLEAAYRLGCGDGAVNQLLGGTPEQMPDRYANASPRRLLPLGVAQLILHGSEDSALPVGMSREYAQSAMRFGDAVRYLELEGAGHMDYLDATSRAHAVLREWLVEMLR